MSRALRAAAWTLLVCGCTDAETGAEPGQALRGLTAAQRARFEHGRAQFDRVFIAAEGLGPFFNENQCSACHTDPAAGGTGDQFVIKATAFDEAAGVCNDLGAEGGANVRTQATPALRDLGILRQAPPAAATATGRFSVPFLFGAGLIEAIPEATILARADPEDSDGDGISGRPGRDAEGRFARFGRKADVASLEDFAAHALHLEMGLTSPLRLQEAPSGATPVPAAADPAPEPEVDSETLLLLADFVRMLAPLQRTAFSDPNERRLAERGELLFAALGCTSCHVPSMRTGASDNRALNRRRINLYSDLLLHDMGPGLADVCTPHAAPSELRTEPLAGIGRRRSFLHDGRAATLREAILLHAGEASAAQARFESLDFLSQEAVIRFLRTL